MNALMLWLSGIRANACELGALAGALDEAEQSVADLDPNAFEMSMERIQGILGCLAEPLTPMLAARLHRAVGMRAFASRGPIAAGAFAAARRIEPDWPLSEILFPPDSPVSQAWSALSVDALRIRTLPSPATGWLVLDGSPGVERAVDLPVVFQRVEPDGSVSMSTYLLPGDPTPSYPTSLGPPTARNGRRATFAVTAAASGAAAAGLWGLSVQGRDRYVDIDDPVSDDRLDGLQTRTNALALGSIASAGLCAVSSVWLVATW